MTRAISISSHASTVGSWTIETGVPADGTIRAFRDLARSIARDFESAFSTLVRIESARADLTWFDQGGQVIRVEESTAVSLDNVGDIDLPAGDVLPTALFIDSGLEQGTHAAPDATATVGSFRLVYSCVLEEENGRETPVDSSVTIATNADVWFGPANAENRNHLTVALMKWEGLRGKPITEWYSSVYKANVTRYGFIES